VDTVLELVVDRHARTTTVRAAGEIDIASAPRLRECLSLLTGSIVVDLRAVSFLDSTGIGVLIGAHNRVCDDGGDLRLRKPQRIVRTAIEVLGLAHLIDD
jgi:anti-anti-sigma factor